MVPTSLAFLAKNAAQKGMDYDYSDLLTKGAISGLKHCAKGVLIFFLVLLLQFFLKKQRKVHLLNKLEKLESEKNRVWKECAQLESELRVVKGRQANLEQETEARTREMDERKLQLEEISAVCKSLSRQLTTDRERLQSLCVERERARLDLENTWVETSQLKRKVKELNDEHKKAAAEASAVNAKMMAAEEETNQATLALKQLLTGLGKLNSLAAPEESPEKDVGALSVEKISGGSITSCAGNKLILPRGKARSRSRQRKDASEKPVRPTPSSRPNASVSGLSAFGCEAASKDGSEEVIQAARKELQEAEEKYGFYSKEAMEAAIELAFHLGPSSPEAGLLLQRALHGCRTLYGDDDLCTLRAVHKLAVFQDHAGEKESALSLYRWARDGRLKQLGSTHPFTLDSMYNLAAFLWCNEELEEAKKAFMSVRAGSMDCFGRNHKATVQCTASLVDILRAKDENEAAANLCQELLDSSEQVHGPHDEQTLKASITLVSLLVASGRLAEAEKAHRLAVQRHEAGLGLEHPSTRELTCSLVDFLTKHNKVAEAERVLRKSLDKCQGRYDQDSALVLGYFEDLAILLKDDGQVSEAESLFRRVLNGRRSTLGSEHEETLRSMSNLAVLLEQQGVASEALQLYSEVQAGRNKTLGADDPKTLSSTLSLGICLADNGRSHEAEALLTSLMADLEKKFGPKHDWVLSCCDKLGALAQENGDLSKAEDMFRRAHEVRTGQGAEGVEESEIASSAYNLAVCLTQQKRNVEAEVYYRAAVSAYSKSHGEDDPFTLDAIFNLAVCLETQGQLEAAAEQYQAAVKGRKRCFGPHDAETLQAECSLMLCRAAIQGA
eukprot:TRINITY_DN76878_c0_g1_i1.p1 TRINITY_DN76878_c0_g1~~TRINITY_DN76878_c0_g1_i1.p1  ORF type:complete len:841 (-),score=194.22 TRINITY_DN76878_c0_g1_i1:399-2921(-)